MIKGKNGNGDDKISFASEGSSDVAVSEATEIGKAEALGEIQAAVVMAKKFPRNEEECAARLIKACGMEEFAGTLEDPKKPSAYYSFPRGGSIISGGSIRLAREMNRLWGNVRVGFFITHDDDESRGITAWAWDLQSNHRESASDFFKKLVQRKTPGGDTIWKVPDERDMRELTFRRAAILVRNCSFALHASYLIDRAVSLCKQTVAGNGGQLAERINLMIYAFAEIHITEDALVRHLKKPLMQCTGEDLAELRGIYESLRDNMISPEEREEMFGTPSKPPPKETDGQPPLSEDQMRPTSQPEPDQRKKPAGKPITDTQRKALFAVLRKSKKTDKDLKGYLLKRWQLESTKDVTQGEVYADALGYAQFVPPEGEPTTKEGIKQEKADPKILALEKIKHSTDATFDDVYKEVIEITALIKNQNDLLEVCGRLTERRRELKK